MSNEALREKLDAEVQAFLAQGGQIEVVPGFSGNVAPLPKHTVQRSVTTKPAEYPRIASTYLLECFAEKREFSTSQLSSATGLTAPWCSTFLKKYRHCFDVRVEKTQLSGGNRAKRRVYWVKNKRTFEKLRDAPVQFKKRKTAKKVKETKADAPRGLQDIKPANYEKIITAILGGEVSRDYIDAKNLGKVIGTTPLTARRYLETLEAQGYVQSVEVKRRRLIYFTTPVLKRNLIRMAEEIGVR